MVDSSKQVVSTPTNKRRKQVASGLLVSIVTVFLCFGGVELVGYIWERNTAQDSLGWTLVASRRMDFKQYDSSEYPYYLFAPDVAYEWEGIPVQINSRGLRTEEVEIPKPEEVFRILNLGDSITFGWEVRQEDTYGKRLEQMLNDNSGTGIRYEVINAGIPTWNLETARNFLMAEGFDYQPDLVIMEVTIVNDIYGSGPTAVFNDPTLFTWLRDHTYFWPFLTTQVRFMRAKQEGPEAFPTLNPPRDAASYYPLEEDDPVWDRVWSITLEMETASKEREIPFIVVMFPTAFQLNSAAHPDVPQRVFGERAASEGIPFIDLLPIYHEACNNAEDDACEGYENLLFADVWMHPNVLGHQLVAEDLYRQFEENQMSTADVQN